MLLYYISQKLINKLKKIILTYYHYKIGQLIKNNTRLYQRKMFNVNKKRSCIKVS